MIWLALLFSLQARADVPLEIQVGRGVEAVELTCDGQTRRVDVRNGRAAFPTAPDRCDVRLVKRSGVTRGNGTWFCNEGGCTLDEPPHADVSNARGRVNIIVLGDVAANMLELTCPSGYRERASIVDHTAVFQSVPVDLCQLHFKGGSPAKFNGIQPGKTYKCSVAGTQAVCKPYDG